MSGNLNRRASSIACAVYETLKKSNITGRMILKLFIITDFIDIQM
jgi:hypothetical protein